MLVLGSRSPRRAELLEAAGIEFIVRAADIDETPQPGEAPADYVLRMAREKAEAVAGSALETVLAADTIVVVDSQIMGKPKDQADAIRMLKALSGRRHEVITGICLLSGRDCVLNSTATGVWFSNLSEAEIEWYVATGEPMDKAGAYGIQGLASRFIDRIEGSYTNVVGLPIALVYQLLSLPAPDASSCPTASS
jgi:septum formation protein